ncbi:MAG: sugar nucleotide-binding protein [Anaerolineales bacterium]
MTDSVDLLVIGGSGFIGANLTQAAFHSGLRVAYTYASHQLDLPVASYQVNLQEVNTLENCLAETLPENIVHCAIPHGDKNIHQAVSVESIRRMTNRLDKSFPPKLIYVSSNAVFTGSKGQYLETNIPDAEKRNDGYRAYAMTRATGEQIAIKNWFNTIVLRTSDVNGKDVGGNLNVRLKKLVKQLKMGKVVQRLNRAYISPTLVTNLVDGILELLNDKFKYRGVLHIAGSERISYYEFTRLLATYIGADISLVIPDEGQAWDNSLDTSYTQSLLKTKLLNVEEQFKRIFL